LEEVKEVQTAKAINEEDPDSWAKGVTEEKERGEMDDAIKDKDLTVTEPNEKGTIAQAQVCPDPATVHQDAFSAIRFAGRVHHSHFADAPANISRHH
jgi:hypothetical protein